MATADRGRKRVWTHGAGRRIAHAPGLGDSKIVAGEREAVEPAAAFRAFGRRRRRRLLRDRGCRDGCANHNERYARQCDADLHAFFVLESDCPKKKPPPDRSDGGFVFKSLAVTYSCMPEGHTTIGAERFHFRVRKGIGWFPLAIAARQTGSRRGRCCSGSAALNSKLGLTHACRISSEYKLTLHCISRCIGRSSKTDWVLYGQASRAISTG